MQEKTEAITTPAQAAEFIPVTQWPHNWPTQGGWRALIFNADTRETSKGTIKGNGLIEAGVIRRVGRRVLVNPPRFFVWVDGQGSANEQAGSFNKAAMPHPADYFAQQGLKLTGGGEWRDAICPFHEDTKPSLRVRPDTGAFRCMVCGAHGGDVLAFHQQRHGLSFKQAAQQLGAWRVAA